MYKMRGLVWWFLTIAGIAGFPSGITQWRKSLKVPNWNCWINSGDRLPWSVRALVVTILFLLPCNTE